MTLGFIIIRHVNSKITDYYWKECYNCIRKFYDNPIIIIDDSSDKNFLNENIFLKNCSIIYDTNYKGCAELLGYYYFYKLKPFDTAVIIHDSIFIQNRIDFQLDSYENCKYLWTFSHQFDYEIRDIIEDELKLFPQKEDLIQLLHAPQIWNGCFGIMSVIRWSFLNDMNSFYNLFNILLPKINTRHYRHGIERALAILITYFDKKQANNFFGDIHKYINWGLSFQEYLTMNTNNYPIIKIWTGR